MSGETIFQRYIRQAFTDNGVVELRHQLGRHWQTGWFDNPADLLGCARERYKAGNLFISLNRPGPRVVSNTMTGAPIGNEDVQFITRLFLDFDPVRPKDCSSTADELQQARWSAQECYKLNRAMGWPDPLVAISGNGAHLLYRCHLPNTAEVRQQLTAIYTGLRTDYSTDRVSFDRAVRNPGRIGPLYGSMKRKGPNTPERPHRQSEIVTWPRDWKQVPRRNIEALANLYFSRLAAPAADTGAHKVTVDQLIRRSVAGDGDYSTLDITAWFRAHGLYRRSLGTYNGSPRHAVKCPFESEHSTISTDEDTSTVIFENADGWPGFFCSHDHCDGRSIADVLQVLGDADAFCSRPFQHTQGNDT